jgi:hypothetical protein
LRKRRQKSSFHTALREQVIQSRKYRVSGPTAPVSFSEATRKR